MKTNKTAVIGGVLAILFLKLLLAGGLFQELSGVDTSSLAIKEAMADTAKENSVNLPVRDVLEDPLARERALMKVLQQKKQELDDQEARLLAEEQRIQDLRQEIVAKIDTLRALEERLGVAIEGEKDQETKRYKDLARVYDSAPPDKVGSMLEKMDVKTAAGVMMNMKRDRAGAVLGFLNPQRAVEITREITRVAGMTAQPLQPPQP